MDQPHQFNLLEKKNQETQAALAKLQQRIETQEYLIQEQSLRIQQLEQELAQAQTRLTQNPQLDTQLTNLKDEILQLVAQRYNRAQTPAPPSTGGLTSQQLENHTKAINELRREIDKTQRYDEQINLARTEATRLSQEISKLQAKTDNLSKQLDERTRPLAYIEEQHRADMRKLSELQAELPELHQKVQTNLTKIQLVSQQVPQFAKYEAALDAIRQEIRGYREHIDFQAAQRERQLKDFSGLAQTTEQRIRQIETAVEKYAEFYQLNKRSLAALQDFQERLQRDQHRFGELQRLTEERQRVEMEKFRADFEQRWQKQATELQPQFVDFQRSKETMQKRVDQLAKIINQLEAQLHMILQIIEEDIQARTQAVTDWAQRFEQIAEEHS